MKGITKRFPGVLAVNHVDLEVNRGEILGLIGENGAGKSTLMKVLMGIEKPDAGEISVQGTPVTIESPAQAFDLGIGMVFQEEAVIPGLQVCENVFLGREDEFVKAGVIDWSRMIRETERLLAMVGLYVNPTTLVEELSVPHRQMVEIARALATVQHIEGQAVIILDEPTSMISPQEVNDLFEVVEGLRDNAAFVFISHRLEEILRFTDRIVVMKDGVVVGECRAKEAQLEDLQALMVGRDLSHDYYCVDEQRLPDDSVILEVEDLQTRQLQGASFHVRHGEILGLAGLIGCGKRDVLRTIFGDEPLIAGRVVLDQSKGLDLNISSAIAEGIGYVPSDRLGEGVITVLSVLENLTLAAISRYSKRGILNLRQEREEGGKYVDRLEVRTPSLDTPIANLSGGNQQKVVLGRWLIRESKLLLMDEPTRGIDVGAKHEVYKMMRRLASEGTSIIMVSDELSELIGLCNRVLVFRDGILTKEVECDGAAKPEEDEIIRYM
jgi:ribose transport system ATP-binding protein